MIGLVPRSDERGTQTVDQFRLQGVIFGSAHSREPSRLLSLQEQEDRILPLNPRKAAQTVPV